MHGKIADVFVDYNNDGDFDDEGERVISDFVFQFMNQHKHGS